MDDIKTIIDRLLSMVAWPVFVGLAIIMFMWAGILFLTAQGDPTKIQNAKKTVLWGSIGVMVGILAYSAINIIKLILGD